ncbi:3'-5' exonuclease domain-containing protein [Mycena sanguinolenta]|uniref:3'-5' exonuclease domain-containing protein n=1 Tax=Mycena sanguinolenta TaxID=230812 RepID=A0A8H7CFC9_9AGAR|nr:3'-5' exonuclease domain-containing protein [Mycena sanguinolenta]
MAYERSFVGFCRACFGIDFDVMLSRHADWIKQHTPRYFPPPHVIVLAMEQVFNAYGHALNAESGLRLFSKTWQKVNAVFELGRQGYLPHIQEVKMFRKSGVDQYGLDKFTSDRGTNRVEGRSHRDTYRKFGTLHGVYSDDILPFLNLPVLTAGPRLTVNCLKDHRTYYNLQMYAKQLTGSIIIPCPSLIVFPSTSTIVLESSTG